MPEGSPCLGCDEPDLKAIESRTAGRAETAGVAHGIIEAGGLDHSGAQIGRDLLFVNIRHLGVRQREKNDVGAANGFCRGKNFQSAAPRR